jgi:hypothetical protein
MFAALAALLAEAAPAAAAAAAEAAPASGNILSALSPSSGGGDIEPAKRVQQPPMQARDAGELLANMASMQRSTQG